MQRIAAALLAALAVSCSPTVTPTNPYDPATPPDQQAKAQLRGSLVVAGGGALARATVFLRQNGRIVRQTVTTDDGAFLFDAVVPGVYLFELGPVGFVPVSMPLTIRPGEDLQLGALAITSAASASTLEGIATLAGEADHGGTLVEAVGRAYTAVTNSQGQFRLDVAEGTYTLRLSHEGFLPVTVQDVTVARGATTLVDPVALAANPGTIAGHVDAEAAEGGILPLADAVVTLEGTSLTGYTNAAGDFALTNVPPGSYIVRVFKEGYGERTEPVLDLEGGELRTLADAIELPLARGGIAGAVSLADKPSDASGIVVEVAGTTRATVTGSDGAYAFDGLLEGTYALSAHKDGYAPRDLGTWTVTAGTVVRVGAAVLTPQGGGVSVAEGSWVNSRAIHLVGAVGGGAGFYKASEDPALPGAWAALPPSGQMPFTLSDRDGAHTVWFVYSADGQTAGSPASASVVLDRQPPSSPAVAVGDGTGWTRAPGGIVSLSLSALDLPATAGAAVSGVARMELSSDAGFATAEARDYALTTTWTLATPGTDGAKTVYARFVDRAGNVSPAASATVILDRVAPASPALALAGPAPSPAGLTTSPVVSATFSASDANRPLAVRLSNTPGFEGARYQPLSSPAAWMLLPNDGAKTVYAQFLDPAGNESLAVPAQITLDTSGPFNPVIAIVEDDARPTDGFTSVLGVSVALSAGGAPTAAQVSEDPTFAGGAVFVQLDGLPQPVSAAFTLGGSGARTVYARFQDAAGNWSTAASARVTVDATRPGAPTLTVRGSLADGAPSSALVAQSVVVLELTNIDDAVEMASAQGAACGGSWAATWYPIAGSAVMLLDPPDGPKTVCVRTRDRAGNESPVASATLELDTTPPTNPAFRDLGNGLTRAVSVSGTLLTDSLDPPHAATSVTYQCFTSTAGVWATCAGAAPMFTFALERNAPNVVGIRARDAAGNVSAGTLVAIAQDDTPPIPPALSAPETTADSVTVTWTPSADTDIDHYLVYYGRATGDFAGTGAAQGDSPLSVPAKNGGSQSLTLTGLDSGTLYYVAVEAVDRAGNGSGPTGQRVAAPSRVNPRLVSTFGARPRSVAVRAEAGNVFAYLATNQGVLQLDVTSDSIAPPVLGRAIVPNFVPDAAPPVVMSCDRSSPTGVVHGHCVVMSGTTLEGAYLRREREVRSPAAVVFFRLDGTESQPTVGSLETMLPARPDRVVAASLGGTSVLLAVERSRVLAYDLGVASFPRQLGAAAMPHELTSVIEAGALGSSLYVYGPVADPAPSGGPPRLQEVVLSASPPALTAADRGVLQDEEGNVLGAAGARAPLATFQGGLYVVHQVTIAPPGEAPVERVTLCSYAPGTAAPESPCVVVAEENQQNAFLVAGGGGHVDVWLDQRTYAYRAVRADRVGASWRLPFGRTPFIDQSDEILSAVVASYATNPPTSAEHVLVVGERSLSRGELRLARYTLSASAVIEAPRYEYSPPTFFVEADGLVVAPNDDRIDVIDIGNPLLPQLRSHPFPNAHFGRMVMQGRWLYAANGDVIDVLTLAGDGTPTRVTSIPMDWSTFDLAISGRWLFAFSRFSRIYAFDLRLPGAPVPVGSVAAENAKAIGAVPWTTSAGTTVVLAASGDTLRTWAFDGTVFTPLGSVSLPTDDYRAVSVTGPLATVSGSLATAIVDLTSPSSPYVRQASAPVSSASVHGGYVIGLAPANGPGGPIYSPYANGTSSDGFSAFSGCSFRETPFGTPALRERAGVLVASCGDNGLTVFSTAGRHPRLLGRHDLSTSWYSAALATDGYSTFLAGPMPSYSTDPAVVYSAPNEPNASGSAPLPSRAQELAPHRRATSFLLVGGLLWSFEYSASTHLSSIVPWEVSNPSWWTVRSPALDLPAGELVPTQPVSDGARVYVPKTGGVNGPTIDAYDLRYPDLLGSAPLASGALGAAVEGIDALGLARDRVFVGVDQGGAQPALIAVLDASSATLSQRTSVVVPPLGAHVTGIAVSGNWLVYTYRAGPGASSSNAYGLRVVHLGPERDGAGASLLGEFGSDQPLSSPVISGDTLLVAINRAVAAYDLLPLWRDGQLPRLVSTPPITEAPWPHPARLVIDGPFAYLLGSSYRVYDLR